MKLSEILDRNKRWSEIDGDLQGFCFARMVSASTSRADSRNAVAQIHLPWLDHLGSRIMGNNTRHFAYTPLKFNIANIAVENGWLEDEVSL